MRHVTLFLSQEQKITEAARKYMPELLDGKALIGLQGKQLEAQLEALTSDRRS